MAQDDLQVRVAVEGAAQDEAERRESGLDVPAPAEGGQCEVEGRVEAAVVRCASYNASRTPCVVPVLVLVLVLVLVRPSLGQARCAAARKRRLLWGCRHDAPGDR
ncbi:hypothetical protein [Streptomyces sp. NPDC057579]|uniref:hypothetical protein n=1 Tax=Streptomyces sp. NPDC057579 TaxID=3346172 RepID=UPI003695D131